MRVIQIWNDMVPVEVGVGGVGGGGGGFEVLLK